LAHLTLHLSWDFRVCMVVFVCTTLWSRGDSLRLLNTGLHHWPHKQHQYHSTCCLVLTKKQNKILHNNIESGGGDIFCNIKIKTILRHNTDRLRGASVNPNRLLRNPPTACTHHVHNFCHGLLSWSCSTQSTTSHSTYNVAERKTGVWFPQKVGIFLLATASARFWDPRSLLSRAGATAWANRIADFRCGTFYGLLYWHFVKYFRHDISEFRIINYYDKDCRKLSYF